MEWLTQLVPGHSPDGSPLLSILGKQTYKFANGKTAWFDDEEQIPFTEADEFWGEGNPVSDPCKLESDLVAYKPMTDVVMLAYAYAPRAVKVPFLDVGLMVGAERKIIRVTGDRKVFVTGSGFSFTTPVPFERMPLDYSRAYGGKDGKSEEGTPYEYPRNPVGKGFIVKNNITALQNLMLPNLEDPGKLLTPQNLVLQKFDKWPEYPAPMGFGYLGKNSHPRYALAGQSLQYFNGASQGLSLAYLSGNETIKLANLDKTHLQFTFGLPGNHPKAWLDVGQGRKEMSMVLQSVIIYKETNQLALVWRGAANYGGLEAMKAFTRLEFGVNE